jgi:F-type H+-transporting ATPase subunit delta
MAELSTLARPYARAAFEYARDKSALSDWSTELQTAAAVVQNEVVASVLGNPSYTAEQLAATLVELCGDSLQEDARNFIKVLASNKRLPLLPEISGLFDEYKATQEKRIDVNVVSAYELSGEIEQTLAEVLSKKLEREVKVDTSVDQNLIGGVLIRAGDLVIDGSVRGQLSKLADAMNS